MSCCSTKRKMRARRSQRAGRRRPPTPGRPSSRRWPTGDRRCGTPTLAPDCRLSCPTVRPLLFLAYPPFCRKLPGFFFGHNTSVFLNIHLTHETYLSSTAKVFDLFLKGIT